MASRNIKHLTSKLQGVYINTAAKYKENYPNRPQPFLTCTHRPAEEQTTLYAQGRTAPGPIVTWAKAGESKHNKLPAEAFDIAFKDAQGLVSWAPDNFKLFADLITDKSIRWGGNFRNKKDSPHFEQQ
jgi:peptidoglycan L-alanyl-D-glutamate endopeptidase CwlK